ncbi:MAG: hypothetical protein HS116_15110 [Planctomycetes bacterium]|nr:hypothetical protein [Planctomycetota bacterium]
MSAELEEHRREQERAAAHIAREARKRAKEREARQEELAQVKARLASLRESYRLKTKDELIAELNGAFAWGGLFVIGMDEKNTEFHLNAGVIGSELVSGCVSRGLEPIGIDLWNTAKCFDCNHPEKLRFHLRHGGLGFALGEIMRRSCLGVGVALFGPTCGYMAWCGGVAAFGPMKNAFALKYNERMGWAKSV